MDKIGKKGKSKSGGSELHKYIKAVLISVLIGEVITILLLFLFAALMCKVDMPLAVTDILILLAASVGALAAGYTNGKILREKGMLFGFVCGGILLLMMLLLNAVFHQSTSLWFLLGKIAAIPLCSAFGGIIGVNQKKKMRY